eukprot:scpid96610/ scgid18880/ 
MHPNPVDRGLRNTLPRLATRQYHLGDRVHGQRVSDAGHGLAQAAYWLDATSLVQRDARLHVLLGFHESNTVHLMRSWCHFATLVAPTSCDSALPSLVGNVRRTAGGCAGDTALIGLGNYHCPVLALHGRLDTHDPDHGLSTARLRRQTGNSRTAGVDSRAL